MPAFKPTRKAKMFFNLLETGVVCGKTPKPETQAATLETPTSTERHSPQVKRTSSICKKLVAKAREVAKLGTWLTTAEADPPVRGVKPENMIWIFGHGRSGSSWLASIMTELKGHTWWNEPYVGGLFGTTYYLLVGDRMRRHKDFILSDHYKKAWLNSIRNFVLEATDIRFKEVADSGYLVIKEPNASIGAPLLMEALPESRMIFLLRDPRDVVASVLAAHRKGSWGRDWQVGGNGIEALVDTDPDGFASHVANVYVLSIEKAKEAYEPHPGPKVLVRYEDLRTHALETMKRIYATLRMPVDEEELAKAVEKHAWENVPDEKKGPDKEYRKAKPGGWKEDLTPEQARIVEEITAPILDEFYPGWSEKAGTKPSTSTGYK